jgi:hypothetical protein
MRRIAIALGASVAMLVAGTIVREVHATTWRSGTLNLPGVTKNYSPIEQVGCYSYGRCPPGYKWKCKDYGRCWCKPC